MNKSSVNDLRIIWAISGKDLFDSFRNKHMLAVVLPALVMVVLYRFIPVMNAADGPGRLRVHSAGNPDALAVLEASPAYRVISFEDIESMQYSLTNEEQPEIALVLPPGFDTALANGEVPGLQGYMLTFFTGDQAAAAESMLEKELETLFGARLDVKVDRIPLQVTSYGITILVSLGLTAAVLMVAIIALPQMILEEKHEKTLDFILVSPARSVHVVVAKAITGIVLTMIVYLLSVAVFHVYFVHWWLAILAGLLGAAFGASLGLALGLIIESRQQLTLWGWLVIAPLFLPMLLVIMDDLIPPVWINILNWVPSVAIMRVIRTSLAAAISRPYFIPQLVLTAGATGILCLFDIWLVRRLDR